MVGEKKREAGLAGLRNAGPGRMDRESQPTQMKTVGILAIWQMSYNAKRKVRRASQLNAGQGLVSIA